MYQQKPQYAGKVIPIDSKVASYCEAIRCQLGLSQRQLAKIASSEFDLYIGQSTIHRIEKGIVRPTKIYLKMLVSLIAGSKIVPSLSCPSCGVVHGDGLDCRGHKVQFVRRNTELKRWRDLPTSELARAIRERVPYVLPPSQS